jgi:cyanophycinase
MGFILLEGGAEFGGQMEIPDRQAIAMAGGVDAPISIIPAAAAPDNNHLRAGNNAAEWFQGLGATQVTVLPVIDRVSADAPEFAGSLQHSKLIFLLGGFPRYLAETLVNTRCLHATQAAYTAGAVIAGSSAGAMVLCDNYYDPVGGQVLPGLGFVGGICVMPHHDTFGSDWAASLGELFADTILVGIDEETGIIDSAPGGCWQVFGKGAITIYRNGQLENYTSEQVFGLDKD